LKSSASTLSTDFTERTQLGRMDTHGTTTL
jgi:hypothetical protein